MTEAIDENACVVTVKGAITAEKSVDVATALEVVRVMYQGAPPPKDADRAVGAGRYAELGTVERAQPLSLREYLEDVQSRSNSAKIAAIARYMRDHEGQSDFTRDDIRNRFRSAGEVMPANFPRDFQVALRVGWIAGDPQAGGRFYVTRRGDEVIDRRFEGAAPTVTRPRRRRRPSPGEDLRQPEGDEQ